jgi:hypothetical protein
MIININCIHSLASLCVRDYYKLFTFLSLDMEILAHWSSQVYPEAQPKGVQATKGC